MQYNYYHRINIYKINYYVDRNNAKKNIYITKFAN